MKYQTKWFLIRLLEQDPEYFIVFGVYSKYQSFGWVKWKYKQYNVGEFK